jgi:hypothetical protein
LQRTWTTGRCANLIQINDGQAVEFDRGSDLFRQKLPSLVLTLTEAADRKKLVPSMLGDVDQEVSDTQGLYMNDSSAVWFVDDKTIACGPIESVNRMMAAYKADPRASPAVLLQLDPQADIAVAVDVQSQSELMMQAAGFNPALILLQQIKAMAVQLNVTGKPGGKLLELVVTAVNAETAGALVPIMNQALDGGKRSFKSLRCLGTRRKTNWRWSSSSGSWIRPVSSKSRTKSGSWCRSRTTSKAARVGGAGNEASGRDCDRDSQDERSEANGLVISQLRIGQWHVPGCGTIGRWQGGTELACPLAALP